LHIDCQKVITKRRENFAYLHEGLKEENFLQLPEIDTFACPMLYPFVTRNDRDLRKELIDKKVFVAKYWQNVLSWVSINSMEYLLAEKLMPLPIDQRYEEDEMKYIVSLINLF
jgi:dTDP-4-amino-4,6-dideoxygalactose transaminase